MPPDRRAIPTFARSDLFTAATNDGLVAALRDAVAPGCRALPGFAWLTSLQLAESDAFTVTSFWSPVPDGNGSGDGSGRATESGRLLDSLSLVPGVERTGSSMYRVHHVQRVAATEPGFLVTAHVVEYAKEHEADAIKWAVDVSEKAASLAGFNLAIVETAPETTLISVTSWRDHAAQRGAFRVLDNLYAEPPAGVDDSTWQRRTGTVIFSVDAKAEGGTSPPAG